MAAGKIRGMIARAILDTNVLRNAAFRSPDLGQELLSAFSSTGVVPAVGEESVCELAALLLREDGKTFEEGRAALAFVRDLPGGEILGPKSDRFRSLFGVAPGGGGLDLRGFVERGASARSREEVATAAFPFARAVMVGRELSAKVFETVEAVRGGLNRLEGEFPVEAAGARWTLRDELIPERFSSPDARRRSLLIGADLLWVGDTASSLRPDLGRTCVWDCAFKTFWQRRVQKTPRGRVPGKPTGKDLNLFVDLNLLSTLFDPTNVFVTDDDALRSLVEKCPEGSRVMGTAEFLRN